MKSRKNNPQKKFIPFLSEAAPLIQQGKITGTWRKNLLPFYPKPGEIFDIHCSYQRLPVKYRCVSRVKCTFGTFCSRFSHLEGMDNTGFEKMWENKWGGFSRDSKEKGWMFILEEVEKQ